VDVELTVTAVAGSAHVYTSKKERFPSPLRAKVGHAGFWLAHDGAASQVVAAIANRDVTFTADNKFTASSEQWSAGETVTVTHKKTAGSGNDCAAAGVYTVQSGSPGLNGVITLTGSSDILKTVTTSGSEKNTDCQIARPAVTSPSVILMHTIKPDEDRLLYIGVKSTAGLHELTDVDGVVDPIYGQRTLQTDYKIKAKIYRYSIDSTLLEPKGAVASEDRRYSVVTSGNINYYELRLLPNSKSATVVVTKHYGDVKVMHSQTKLPTQDTSIGYDTIYPSGAVTWSGASSPTLTFTITFDRINRAEMHVYVAILGQGQIDGSTALADSAYDISVTESALAGTVDASGNRIAPSAVQAGTSFDVVFSSSQLDTYRFYQLQVGPPDTSMSIRSRDKVGSRTTLLGTDPASWGLDWTEALTPTWIQKHDDEYDMDVTLTLTGVILPGIAARDVTFTLANKFSAALSPAETWAQGEMAVIANKNSGSTGFDCTAAGTYAVSSVASGVVTLNPAGATIVATVAYIAAIAARAVAFTADNKFYAAQGETWVQGQTVLITDGGSGCAAASGTFVVASVSSAVAPQLPLIAVTPGGVAALQTVPSSVNHDCRVSRAGVAAVNNDCTVARTAIYPTLYGSSREVYPSAERGYDVKSTDGTLTVPHFTFSDQLVYFSMTSAVAATVSATVQIADKVQGQLTSDTAFTVRTCPNSCSSHGTCIDDCDLDRITANTCPTQPYCLCDDGWVHGVVNDCSVQAFGTAAGQPGVRIPIAWKTLANPTAPATKLFEGTAGLSIPYEVFSAPPYAKVRIYIDGAAYPNNSSNTVVMPASGTTASGEDTYFFVKAYHQIPEIQHTITFNLVSDSGVLLGTDSTTFKVAEMYGCANNCGGNGVCHRGYCICYDGWAGEDCNQAVDDFAVATGTATLTTTSMVRLSGIGGTGLSGAVAAGSTVAQAGTPGAAGTILQAAAQGATSVLVKVTSGTFTATGALTITVAGANAVTGTPASVAAVALTQGSWNETKAFKPLHGYSATVKQNNTLAVQANKEKEQMAMAAKTASISRENARLVTSAAAVKTKLSAHSVDTANKLSANKANLQTLTDRLHREHDRKFVQIQQAKEESARLKVENQELHIDHKRSLYEHQEAANNRYDAAMKSRLADRAKKRDQIIQDMKQKNFILNSLAQANGPRVKTSDIKEPVCTTDQLGKITCTEGASATPFQTAAGYKTTGEVINIPASSTSGTPPRETVVRPSSDTIQIGNEMDPNLYANIPRG